MRIPKPVTVDFETFGIERRPQYPPVPVGVSIKVFGKKPRYLSWGHASNNNCTWGEARKALLEIWFNEQGLLFQNGKFDIDVAEEHMDLPLPPADKIHDTMFLLFLDDPHQTELSLKPSAARLLGMPADEQDEVVEWLVKHQPVDGIKISASKQSDHYAMKYVAFVPGDIVGRYANGDTIRTEKIFHLLYRKTVERGMLESYKREQTLMPILLQMERQGVPVDLKRLRSDVNMYSDWRRKIEQWVIKRIKAPADINLRSAAQVLKAMIASDKVDVDKLGVTPTGKPKSDKDSLLEGVKDKELLGVMKYLTQLNTCLGTFMEPWLDMAEKSDGLIFTTWNQTKASQGDANVGTRTGRLSSTPNFQNIPKEFSPIFKEDESDPKKAKSLPKCPWSDLPNLPYCRGYITPFKGEVLIDRDYSQQEPRILAHFDGGDLMIRYNDEPWVDFHDFAKTELEYMGLFYDRKPVKNTNLGLIYGMGVGKLALKNNMAVDEASTLKKAVLKLYPGLSDMYKDMKARAKSKTPIRTWGGREYYCEDPKYDEKRRRFMEFDYKLVNVLIQGSAADCTKEAIIRFDKVRKACWKIILNVHDQISVSVPRSDVKEAMEALRVAMESVEFDVPMLSEGSTSSTNWNELIDYDKKGVRCNAK